MTDWTLNLPQCLGPFGCADTAPASRTDTRQLCSPKPCTTHTQEPRTSLTMKQISATSLWSGQTDLKPYSSSLRDKQTAATNTTERGGGQSLSGYHVFANPLKKKNNNKTS